MNEGNAVNSTEGIFFVCLFLCFEIVLILCELLLGVWDIFDLEIKYINSNLKGF